MSEPRHPRCPIDEEVGWRLEQPGAEPAAGQGLVAGLRALWRRTVNDAVDAAGRVTGRAPRLILDPSRAPGAPGQVAVALAQEGNTVLLRLRGWLEGPRGVVLLEQLARAHARLLLAGERWGQPAPAPDAESLAPLTVASVIDEPEALLRALKPGH